MDNALTVDVADSLCRLKENVNLIQIGVTLSRIGVAVHNFERENMVPKRKQLLNNVTVENFNISLTNQKRPVRPE